jgi:hypothetical protein
MSDYLFSSTQLKAGFLAKQIQSIYHAHPPQVHEFHGQWGSLAVAVNRYNGFMPFENERHIFIAIGGPVLYFQDNKFLTQENSNEATKSIYQRWILEKQIEWDEDLSGPFTFLLVNKHEISAQVITDLMSFIPMYIYQDNQQFALGTHIDALAKSSQQTYNIDEVSIADFALNDVVTYPYTIYRNIKQLSSSSLITISISECSAKHYWLPTESTQFESINSASQYLREGISDFVERVTQNMDQVAHFISAGEDSRALAGLLPNKLKRNSYIFLDHMNREGGIAGKVAAIYGAEFNVGYRSKTHYLDILPEATDLVGNGHQYIHAHSLGFDKEFKLAEYTAVFGGFLADTVLKGLNVKKFKGYGHLPFMPQIKSKKSNPCGLRFKKLADFIRYKDLVKGRQEERYRQIKKLRPTSADEWFHFYPASMCKEFPNLYVTRRLFKSYEPFMCKEVIKVSAAVPTSWKLNRRLFHKAMKPYLKPSKWQLHADGRLPYFSWWANMPLQFIIWFYRHIAKRVGLIRGNQGPWGDWQELFKSSQWKKAVQDYTTKNSQLAKKISNKSLEEILLSDKSTTAQKTNILQLLSGVRIN